LNSHISIRSRPPPLTDHLWWGLHEFHYPQLGWNDVAQWHVDEDAASAPLGLDRWLDFSVYHAGGMDTLTGATRWQVSSEDEEDYMAEDLFLVRDHLGSVVMTLKAKKTCTMWMEPPGPGEGGPSECGTWGYVLTLQESYDYDPYGTPTIHAPATDGNIGSEGRLVTRPTTSTFDLVGTKSSHTLLDRNDIGRPNGTPGNTWVRNGAVPAGQSHYGWNYLFTARPWDSDVRQYNIRHRWYDPLQGRWTAVDPIGYRGGLNQYQYCGGNPVSFIDLLGLDEIFCFDVQLRMPVPDAAFEFDDGPVEFEDDKTFKFSVSFPDGSKPEDVEKIKAALRSGEFQNQLQKLKTEYRLKVVEKLESKNECGTETVYTIEFMPFDVPLKHPETKEVIKRDDGTTVNASALAPVDGDKLYFTPTGLESPGDSIARTIQHELGHSIGLGHDTYEAIEEGLGAGFHNWDYLRKYGIGLAPSISPTPTPSAK